MRPCLVAIGVADSAGAPMRSVAEARLEPGVGVVGDRYALGRGHWQEWPDREVTLVAKETADVLGLDALALRRNLVVQAVDLDALVGQRFTIGEARLMGVRACDPCRHLERLLAWPGLVEALFRRGGLRARIEAAGTVRVGDDVTRLA